MNVPSKGNKKLEVILGRVNKDALLQSYWECGNINAVKRLGYSDHGKVHFAIVANIGLKIFRNLIEHGVKPSVVTDHGLTVQDGEVVVFLASILHDLGMTVARENHQIFSVPLAAQILPGLLDGLYGDHEKAIIVSETLNAIYSHEAGTRVLTMEAGVVRVADALDLKEGRARIPFEQGKVDIYSISALSISDVDISSLPEKPVVISIKMHTEAGIFQIDQLLKQKIAGTGLEKYISVVAEVVEGRKKHVLSRYEIKS